MHNHLACARKHTGGTKPRLFDAVTLSILAVITAMVIAHQLVMWSLEYEVRVTVTSVEIERIDKPEPTFVASMGGHS